MGNLDAPILALAVALISAGPAIGAELCPKYGTCVPADAFECAAVEGENVRRVCYSEPKRYMVIRLKRTDYHCCEIDAGTVAALKSAASPDAFFASSIKSDATGRRFDCRDHEVPTF